MGDVAKLLESLHPMREPPPPAPITPYLLMLLVGCAAAVAMLVLAWRLRRRRSALRSAAAAALTAARGLAPAERLAAQAHLLRRLARSLAGDAAARANGETWLRTLDEIFATRFFTEGTGVVFGDRLYRRAADVDLDALDHALLGLVAQVRLPRVAAG